MPRFEFKPIHNFFRVQISTIKYAKNINADTIGLHVYSNSPTKIFFLLGLLEYCGTNATFVPHKKGHIGLLDKTIRYLSFNFLTKNFPLKITHLTRNFFTKTYFFKPTFQISNDAIEQHCIFIILKLTNKTLVN